MKRLFVILAAAAVFFSPAAAEPTPKQAALESLRKRYAANGPFRRWSCRAESAETCRKLLGADGVFSDMAARQRELREQRKRTDLIDAGEFARKAFDRLWRLSEEFRNGGKRDEELKRRIFRGIVNYGAIENDRRTDFRRWHDSCFAIPTAAINIYFCFFDVMNGVENGGGPEEARAAHAMLRRIAMQVWTTPARKDATDRDPVSVARFRGDDAWLTANAVSYRAVFPCAVMFRSEKMMDVLAEVFGRSLEELSQTARPGAFWPEGLTADGAAWGHGSQCCVWEYPFFGLNSSTEFMAMLRNTPWRETFTPEKIAILMNFIRGSSFFFHNGYEAPFLNRYSTETGAQKRRVIGTRAVANRILYCWKEVLTDEQRRELEQFCREAEGGAPRMENHPAGTYRGSRCFFNNDRVIHKSAGRHLMIAMCSLRTDGVESDKFNNDAYNMFVCDGAVYLQREGNEYARAVGAFDWTAWPGTTLREVPFSKLLPVKNRGYCSRHGFAGGATSGTDFAAGFRYEKMNSADKPGYRKTLRIVDAAQPPIFGVAAHKSYFLFGETLLALGSGITNLTPREPGTIRTTLEQTLLAPGSRSENGWEINNGFAYRVLAEHTAGKVEVRRSEEPTRWRKLSAGNRNRPEGLLPLFRMTIDHGRNARNASYAYLVDLAGRTDAPEPRILSNTPRLQAAESADGRTLGAVFFDESAVLEIPAGRITVSAPCILLLESGPERQKLTVTDARMDPELAELTVTAPFGAVKIALPRGKQCGRPGTVLLPLP